jgi:hypothetical protein
MGSGYDLPKERRYIFFAQPSTRRESVPPREKTVNSHPCTTTWCQVVISQAGVPQ